MRILFHVYNISGYLIACLTELSKQHEIAVIETPCNGVGKGVLTNNVHWIDRTRINNASDIDANLGSIQPDMFFCGGWSDKICVEYARILHRRGCKTILLADTPWQGKARQVVHCLYSRLYLTRFFDFAWVAGKSQERYMRYLGFPIERIRRGYYCANTNKFAPIGQERIECYSKTHKWPHVMLYVGRYVAAKNMRRMERAFLNAVVQMPNADWILQCIGTGEMWNERTIHPRIMHLGYKSPDEIQNFIKNAGCFVLPSVYEPWGVVVQEAALMALPMLCSNQIQAATSYLNDGDNGYLFDPLDENEICSAFKKIMALPDEDLSKMGCISQALGNKYTLVDWADRAAGFYYD